MHNHVQDKQPGVVAVALNPAVDRTLFLADFALGQVNRVDRERMDPGGKGINVAKVIKTLAHEVMVTGFLGHNNIQLFNDYFQHEEIENCCVEYAGDTRVNIKIVNETTSLVSEINFPGVTLQEYELAQLYGTICRLADRYQWFVFSGSLPPGAPDSLYADLIVMLRRCGCKVMLDTSGAALRSGIQAQPFAVKPNLCELEELLGRTISPERSSGELDRAVDELLDSGIGLVAVSMGAQGALIAQGDQRLLVRPPVMSGGSTVGAGDALTAGLTVGQARGLSLADGARLAAAAAAAAVALPGTQAAALPAVMSLLDQVTVEAWR